MTGHEWRGFGLPFPHVADAKTRPGPTLVREPFHRDGWVYEEKVDGRHILAYKDGRCGSSAATGAATRAFRDGTDPNQEGETQGFTRFRCRACPRADPARSPGVVAGSDLGPVCRGDALLDRTIFAVEPKAYSDFLMRLDAPPRPNDRLRRTLRTPPPWAE